MKNCSINRPPKRPASQRVVEYQFRRSGISHLAWWVNSGLFPGGIRPLRPHEGTRCTPTSPGTHDGVSIWHRRSKGPRGAGRATASNLDTLLDRGFGRRVRMLLSFQRPSHLFRKGIPSSGASRTVRFRSGPVSIAPVPPRRKDLRARADCRTTRPETAPGSSSARGHAGVQARSAKRGPGLMTAPGPSPSAGGAGRRSRSARPAARCRGRGGRRSRESSPRRR